jgi:ABC-type nickel/cobalt efflux system permease component RcnA
VRRPHLFLTFAGSICLRYRGEKSTNTDSAARRQGAAASVFVPKTDTAEHCWSLRSSCAEARRESTSGRPQLLLTSSADLLYWYKSTTSDTQVRELRGGLTLRTEACTRHTHTHMHTHTHTHTLRTEACTAAASSHSPTPANTSPMAARTRSSSVNAGPRLLILAALSLCVLLR